MNSRVPSEISDFQSTFCLRKSRFSLHKNLSGIVLMLSKALQTCSLKSEDAFTYPQSQHMISTSQYKNPIRHLTKSIDSRWSSEISDFQSTFCLEKVDFPCMKNGQASF